MNCVQIAVYLKKVCDLLKIAFLIDQKNCNLLHH